MLDMRESVSRQDFLLQLGVVAYRLKRSFMQGEQFHDLDGTGATPLIHRRFIGMHCFD